MAKKPTLTTVSSGYQSTTQLNANLNAINNALDNTLSLDGSTPNAMTADIDLNSNDILNVATTHTTQLYLGGTRVIAAGDINAVSNMDIDEFTGDGSTVAYVLSSTPLSIDVVLVNVDGVAQLATSYTLSVATLTFSEAPPLNSAIQIRYFTDIALGATTSADLVSYSQGSTGHVTRTVEARLRDHVSVLDFGAVGDGVTDDTAAFNAAWSATNPKAVLVPAASYKITGTVTGKFFSFGAATVVGGSVATITNLDAVQPGPSDFGAIDNTGVYVRATNQTAFETLYALQGSSIDLLGKVWPVTSVPKVAAHNGWFSVVIGASFDARFPAKGTVSANRVTLSDVTRYNAWAQDTFAMWDETDTPIAMWNEGNNHAGNPPDNVTNGVTMRLQGGVWQRKEYILKDEEVHWCSAATIVDGMHLVARRDDDTNDYRLFHKRLGYRMQLVDVINVTNGAEVFSINYSDFPAVYGTPALVEGMFAYFSSVDNVGGLAISGAYPCSYIRDTRIEFDRNAAFTSTETLGGGDFQMVFPETEWAELPIRFVDGVTTGSISEAINDKWIDQGNASSSSFNLHCMVGDPNDAGTFYVGLSGGNFNVAIAKVLRPFDTNSAREVEWVREIPCNSGYAEPTFVKDQATGNFYGFLRTQNAATLGAGFFWTDDDFVTVTLTEFPTGSLHKEPLPCALYDGKIYVTAADNRGGVGVYDVSTEPADVNVYLWEATIADAESAGAQAFIDNVPEVIDTVRHGNQYFSVTNSVGVGSMVVSQKTGIMRVLYGGDLQETSSSSGYIPADPTQMYCYSRNLTARDYSINDRVYSHTSGFWSYSGLPSHADGDYLVFENVLAGTAPRIMDATTGLFSVPQTGSYELSLSVAYGIGDTSERSVRIVDEAGVSRLNVFLCYANPASATHYTSGTSTVILNLVAGEKFYLEVSSADGTRDSQARSTLAIKLLM
jgi:hypothetical protein